MDIGGTKQKIQKMIDAAEQLYAKMNEVVEQLTELKQRVEATGERLEAVERDVAEQRAILEALAEREGIDVEEALAAAELPDPGDDGAGDAAGTSDAAGDAGEGTAAE